MSVALRAVFATVVALAVYSTVSVAPRASANSQGVPCRVLDQIHESLDDDIGAGIDGVRQTLANPPQPLLLPATVGPLQKIAADQKLDMVDHGIHYINEIDIGTPVPGLDPLLERLRGSAAAMKDAVIAAFPTSLERFDSDDPTLTRVVHQAQPQPSTWQAIDDADQKKNDVYALVNGLHGHCSP